MLVGETLDLPLRLAAQVSVRGADKEVGSLRHPGHLVLQNQGGRLLHPPHPLHGIAAQVRAALGAAAALPPRDGAVDTPPIAQRADLGVGGQGCIHGQGVVSGDHCQRKALTDEGAGHPPRLRAPHHPGQHSQGLQLHGTAPSAMRLGGMPQGADVAGYAGGDFQSSQTGDFLFGTLQPLVRRVVRLHLPTVRRQNDQRMALGYRLRRGHPCTPGRRTLCVPVPCPQRDCADAGVGSVQVVGGTLDLRSPALKVGTAVPLLRCAFAFRKGGKDVGIVTRCRGQTLQLGSVRVCPSHEEGRLRRGQRGRGRGLTRPLRLHETGILSQCLQWIGA